jgi:hypothetical protein
MKNIFLYGLLFFISLNCFQIAFKNPDGYPPTLRFSEERINKFNQLWTKFKNKYKFNNAKIEIDTLLLIPDLRTDHGINILPSLKDTITNEYALAVILKFIDEWKELFNVSSSELILVAQGEQNDLRGELYYFQFEKRFPYQLEISDPSKSGKVNVQISKLGVLHYFHSNCVPTLLFSSGDISINENQAKEVIIGKEISYGGWKSLIKKINISKDDIISTNLTMTLVYRWSHPRDLKTRYVEYRKAWKISLNCWDVYVDAVTGEDLDYVIGTCIY